jgi:hypothetical protein
MSHRRGATEPHEENRKEGGQWIARVVDFDPVSGLLVATAAFATWAAAMAWLARMRKLADS